MSLLRSARFPAIVLLSAAAVGLIVANSPLGPAVDEFMHTDLGIPGAISQDRNVDVRVGRTVFVRIAEEILHDQRKQR